MAQRSLLFCATAREGLVVYQLNRNFVVVATFSPIEQFLEQWSSVSIRQVGIASQHGYHRSHQVFTFSCASHRPGSYHRIQVILYTTRFESKFHRYVWYRINQQHPPQQSNASNSNVEQNNNKWVAWGNQLYLVNRTITCLNNKWS